MLRTRERVVGVVGIAIVVVVAFAVVALLGSARRSGREALLDAKVAQVEALANSFNQRVASALGSTSGLAVRDWELTPGSAADLDQLESFLGPDARTGFFLLDADSRITQGVLFTDPDDIGATFDRRGWSTVESSDPFQAGRGVLLPVDAGITTASPTYAFALPIVDRTSGAYRGAFVFEVDVTSESDFNVEIQQLARPDKQSEDYFFVDDAGTVVASTELAALANPLAADLETLPVGQHDLDGQVVVVADVPAAGWRLVQREDRAELEEGLAGPLQVTGIIVVVVLGVAGVLLVVGVVRRLGQAREEARRLQELADSKEEFVSIVSHELRTPVAGILGFLQTTVDHWPVMSDDEREAAVRRAVRNSRRLQALTRDVLETEAIESGAMAFSMEPADLREEVDTAVETARELDPSRDVHLETTAQAVPVSIDPDRIQQAIANLLDNAAKNSPPSEPIDVTLAVEDGLATIRVRDRGVGLDAAVADRMFEKFVRGRDHDVTGTGLGLYITRRILEAHEGTVDADAAPEGGAVFTLRLPLRTG